MKFDPNGAKVAIFRWKITKIAQWLGAPPPDHHLWPVICEKCIQSAQFDAFFRQFFFHLWIQPPSPLYGSKNNYLTFCIAKTNAIWYLSTSCFVKWCFTNCQNVISSNPGPTAACLNAVIDNPLVGDFNWCCNTASIWVQRQDTLKTNINVGAGIVCSGHLY